MMNRTQALLLMVVWALCGTIWAWNAWATSCSGPDTVALLELESVQVDGVDAEISDYQEPGTEYVFIGGRDQLKIGTYREHFDRVEEAP